MTRYVLQRILTMLVVIWVIITATFFMMRALPGGPFASEKNIPEAIKKNIERRYKLDRPLSEQYFDYLKNAAQFDLGPSYKYQGMTVNQIISKGFPVSATIGGISVLVSLVIGVPVGIWAAMRHNGVFDRVTSGLAILTAAAPSFVIAGLLQYFLSFKLRWFPAATWGTPEHMVLPVIALCSFSLAWLVKLTRSSMLEVINQDYVRTARAKGIPELAIIWRHMLRNAMVPIIASLAPLTAGVLTGSFIVESIFAIPGVGRDFVISISNRDYTVTLGMTIFFGFLLISFTLIGDILTAFVDPRVRLDKEG
ncbi:MAG TPA: ABC transporter permease [Symbiobacteriaceae bacterium]|jgi:oligopeptide transport system permease protein|nr:ABC transporter permease [Symbiobacteriaceae bacterium]